MTTTRREFLESLLHVSLLPLVGLGAGCGGDSTGPTADSLRDGGPTQCTSITVSIGTNHGHTLLVPLVDVQAGNSRTYTLSSNGSHTHTVRITNVDFVTLANGGTLTLTSSNDAGHAHTVTVGCVQTLADAGTDAGSDSGLDAGTNDAGSNDAGNDDAATGDSGSDGSVASCSTVSTLIGANHGHTLTVPAADVAAGVEKSYTLTTNGTHSHTLLVTAAEFATLATGASVVKDSATSPSPGHEHTVTLMCG